MVRKYTFQEVKREFEERGYELLETSYINSGTKMKYRCLKHPETIKSMRFAHLKRGVKCPECAKEIDSKNKTLDYSVVDNAFLDAGYLLLEKDYTSSKQPLKYRCLIHPEKDLFIRYNDLKKGIRCPYCSGGGVPDIKDIREEFKRKGYKLLTRKYKNGTTKLRYLCEKHGEQTVGYMDFKHKDAGCKGCAIEKLTGENSPSWKGGLRELNKYLREKMYEWRNEQLKKAHFRCDITNSNKKLEVHHVKPYHIMRDEALKELNLDYRNKRNKYNQEELDSIVEKLKEKHNETESVVLTRPVHREFHKLYGYETTYEDYLEFKRMKLEELNNGLR